MPTVTCPQYPQLQHLLLRYARHMLTKPPDFEEDRSDIDLDIQLLLSNSAPLFQSRNPAVLSYLVATHQLYYLKHSPYSLRLPSPCALKLQMHEQFAMHDAMVLLLYSLRFAYANLGSQQSVCYGDVIRLPVDMGWLWVAYFNHWMSQDLWGWSAFEASAKVDRGLALDVGFGKAKIWATWDDRQFHAAWGHSGPVRPTIRMDNSLPSPPQSNEGHIDTDNSDYARKDDLQLASVPQ
ncbi:hypothetical protein JB92DRAFT_2830559 [Gautieria morchelliformis]|nr:hypothetical protein JB92DRAFT_2830559 [Gautieria morchelliformis]